MPAMGTAVIDLCRSTAAFEFSLIAVVENGGIWI